MVHYKIAMIGLGSIGKRHIRNLSEIMERKKCTFSIDLIRSGYGKEIEDNISCLINKVYSLKDEIPKDYNIIFVTNPTSLHYETIKRFKNHTIHFFIEKPVFDNCDVMLQGLMEDSKGIYYIACPLRYMKVVQYLKNNIDFNGVYSARAICSSYLPEWRPGTDYRESYSARKELGGGVAIDLIHEWDYLFYFFGAPESVKCFRDKVSELEITSDDLAIYIAKYKNCMLELHLDYFGKKNVREIELYTKDDVIVGDIQNSCVKYLKSGQSITFEEERDDFQIRELETFLDIVDGRIENHNDIYKAYEVLGVALGGEA